MHLLRILLVCRGAVCGCCLLALSLNGRASTEAETASAVMVENGTVIPVKKTSALPQKSSGETLYLSSAVRMNHPSATPSPVSNRKVAPPSGSVAAATKASRTGVAQPSRTPAPITVRKHASGNRSSAPGGTEDDPGDDYGKSQSLPDPIQPVNRGTFWFNHQLYHYVFTPLNKAYKFILPQPVRTGISNVFLNTEYPVRFVNDLLQGKPGRAGLETEKFLVNTTAGVGGIFRVSDKIHSLADVPQTDTSATFAKWGIPPGCYIVWPVIGPKSLRDTVGFAGDIALDPVTWITYGAVGGLAGAASLAVSAPSTTTKTSDKLDTYETVTRTSIDRYSAIRSAYEQNRKKVESR